MKLIIVQVYSLIRYFTLKEIISRWNLLVQICCFDSHYSIWERERAGEKKEGGREKGGKKERERRRNNPFNNPLMYWESFDLCKPSGCWLCDRWEMTTWLQRVKMCLRYSWAVFVVPTGVNINQIIYREVGLDTEELDFDSCSYFIP